MDIFFKCIHCGQRLVVDDAGIGMEIPCPQCAKLVVIPAESTVPPEEENIPSPLPAPKLPEPVLPPKPGVTFASRPLMVVPPPPPLVPAKPAPVVEAPVPKNLHAPLAPARVRRPLVSPPPPRVPRPAPALAPALIEMLAPVPSNLHVPAAPRRVRLPLAQPPPPRASWSAPALPAGLLASLTPPVTPPPAAPAPPAPPRAPAFAPPAAKLPALPPAPEVDEPPPPTPPAPPLAPRAPREAPAFALPAEKLPEPPPQPKLPEPVLPLTVVAVASPAPVLPPVELPPLPVTPKLPEPVLTAPPPAPPAPRAPRKAPAFASRAAKLPPTPAAPKLPVPVLSPVPVAVVVAPPPPPAPRAPQKAPAFAPLAAKLPSPPPAPKLPEPVLPPASVVAVAPPPPPAPVPLAPPAPAPMLQGIVPPLDFGFPKAELTPALPKPAAKAMATAEQLSALIAKPAAQMPVALAPPAVRLVDISGPAKVEADQWRDLAAALAKQLWSSRSSLPLRATVIEAFLHAMPRFVGIRGDASVSADADGVRGRWSDPFAGDRLDVVERFDRPDFEGIAARVSELIERWMQHQENMARQPGSDAEEVSFTMMPVPHSAVVSFGMNYRQRGTMGRKRVTCWVARVGENRFLFVGKIPPSVSVTLPGFVQSFRAEAGEPSLPLPREQILNMPPPPNVDSENALTVRRLMINFCEAYLVRFDNRLAAELYDQIRRRREIARAIIPGMLQVMPSSREKRMLQQLSREL